MAVTKKKTKTLRVKKQATISVGTVVARRVVALLLLLAFIGGIGFMAVKGLQAVSRFLFSANPQFAIRQIEISSDGQLPTDWLQGQANLEYGANLFAVKPEDIRRELKRVPKVQSVSIRRQLPGRLIVEVKERFSVAQISYKSKGIYPQTVDRFGVVLPPTGGSEKLPLIYGVAELEDPRNLRPGTHITASGLQHSLDVINLCNTTPWGRMINVVSIDAAYQDFVKVYLSDQTLVYVPQTRLEVLEGKMRRLVAVLQVARDNDKEAAQVDLTSDGINVPVKYR